MNTRNRNPTFECADLLEQRFLATGVLDRTGRFLVKRFLRTDGTDAVVELCDGSELRIWMGLADLTLDLEADEPTLRSLRTAHAEYRSRR